MRWGDLKLYSATIRSDGQLHGMQNTVKPPEPPSPPAPPAPAAPSPAPRTALPLQKDQLLILAIAFLLLNEKGNDKFLLAALAYILLA